MAREIVVSKSSLNDAFLKLLQQNPDAQVPDILSIFEKTEGEGSLRKLTLTVQDIKSIKDPDFEDHSIRDELKKMTTQITEYLKNAEAEAGKDWAGKTRSEIEQVVQPSDHLAKFAFAEAMRRLNEEQAFDHFGGERRGAKLGLKK